MDVIRSCDSPIICSLTTEQILGEKLFGECKERFNDYRWTVALLCDCLESVESSILFDSHDVEDGIGLVTFGESFMEYNVVYEDYFLFKNVKYTYGHELY